MGVFSTPARPPPRHGCRFAGAGGGNLSCVSKPFEITVEAVFVLRGRGVAVAGAHKGGEIRTGDKAELVGDEGTIPIDEVRVEVHRPLGKLAVVLVGIDRDQVHVGQVLRKPRPPKKSKAGKEQVPDPLKY
jgi:translation elongation factor EF-Tu-like GTPase